MFVLSIVNRLNQLKLSHLMICSSTSKARMTMTVYVENINIFATQWKFLRQYRVIHSVIKPILSPIYILKHMQYQKTT
jgi:hypothetical protein